MIENNTLFKGYPKIPRWEKRNYQITEKLDGTNGCIIVNNGEIHVQSRRNMLYLGYDNFGFYDWAMEHKEELLKLGDGYHYGEWIGKGIQRNYGLDHRRFYLFKPWLAIEIPDCVHTIPEIQMEPSAAAQYVKNNGSTVIDGWMRTEGLVIVERLTGATYKMIWDK